MSTATEYRPQSLTGRLPSKRVYRRSAVNTGFRGTFVRDNYRSCCIKDSVLLDANCIDMIQSHRGFSLRKAA